MSNSVQPRGQQPTRLLCPQDSPGKNTRVLHRSKYSYFYKAINVVYEVIEVRINAYEINVIKDDIEF